VQIVRISLDYWLGKLTAASGCRAPRVIYQKNQPQGEVHSLFRTHSQTAGFLNRFSGSGTDVAVLALHFAQILRTAICSPISIEKGNKLTQDLSYSQVIGLGFFPKQKTLTKTPRWTDFKAQKHSSEKVASIGVTSSFLTIER
jgi:hypothetical protein